MPSTRALHPRLQAVWNHHGRDAGVYYLDPQQSPIILFASSLYHLCPLSSLMLAVGYQFDHGAIAVGFFVFVSNSIFLGILLCELFHLFCRRVSKLWR